MKTFYEQRILPWAIDRIMARQAFTTERARLVPLAQGRVLEIGLGSGFNLPHYARQVERLFALEPSARLQRFAADRVRAAPFPVTFVGLTAESLPLDDRSMDTVLSTWTLCTVPDVNRALAEIGRVLKPEGRFLFIEHGRSPDRRVRFIQETLSPLWQRIGGGCTLDRPMDELIAGAGFRFERSENGPMGGAGPLSFLFRGVARRP
ncbi:MAG: class I SAM-dependent methyltransferase [Magnetococcales bacterium]|nr:class I SAM-dependent methyltransferase [Magnetococcales bacterium]